MRCFRRRHPFLHTSSNLFCRNLTALYNGQRLVDCVILTPPSPLFHHPCTPYTHALVSSGVSRTYSLRTPKFRRAPCTPNNSRAACLANARPYILLDSSRPTGHISAVLLVSITSLRLPTFIDDDTDPWEYTIRQDIFRRSEDPASSTSQHPVLSVFYHFVSPMALDTSLVATNAIADHASVSPTSFPQSSVR